MRAVLRPSRGHRPAASARRQGQRCTCLIVLAVCTLVVSLIGNFVVTIRSGDPRHGVFGHKEPVESVATRELIEAANEAARAAVGALDRPDWTVVADSCVEQRRTAGPPRDVILGLAVHYEGAALLPLLESLAIACYTPAQPTEEGQCCPLELVLWVGYNGKGAGAVFSRYTPYFLTLLPFSDAVKEVADSHGHGGDRRAGVDWSGASAVVLRLVVFRQWIEEQIRQGTRWIPGSGGRILVADTGDTYFQRFPFDGLLPSSGGNKRVVVSSEDRGTLGSAHVNQMWLERSFGRDVMIKSSSSPLCPPPANAAAGSRMQLQYCPVANAGVYGGDYKAIQDLIDVMLEELSRSRAQPRAYGADQAALQVALYAGGVERAGLGVAMHPPRGGPVATEPCVVASLRRADSNMRGASGTRNGWLWANDDGVVDIVHMWDRCEATRDAFSSRFSALMRLLRMSVHPRSSAAAALAAEFETTNASDNPPWIW